MTPARGRAKIRTSNDRSGGRTRQSVIPRSTPGQQVSFEPALALVFAGIESRTCPRARGTRHSRLRGHPTDGWSLRKPLRGGSRASHQDENAEVAFDPGSARHHRAGTVQQPAYPGRQRAPGYGTLTGCGRGSRHAQVAQQNAAIGVRWRPSAVALRRQSAISGISRRFDLNSALGLMLSSSFRLLDVCGVLGIRASRRHPGEPGRCPRPASRRLPSGPVQPWAI